MNDTNDKTDIRFRDLFRKAGLESPPAGFTDDVMKRVAALAPESQQADERASLGRWMGYVGIAFLAAAGLGGMYFFGIGILPESFKPIFSPVIGNMFDSFKGIFDSVEVSGTTIAIILGFAFLVVLERVLHRMRLTRNIHLSF